MRQTTSAILIPPFAVRVPADEIRASKYDLSISLYKQIEHKEIEYEKPGVIMEKVIQLEKQIENDIEAIKAMIP